MKIMYLENLHGYGIVTVFNPVTGFLFVKSCTSLHKTSKIRNYIPLSHLTSNGREGV